MARTARPRFVGVVVLKLGACGRFPTLFPRFSHAFPTLQVDSDPHRDHVVRANGCVWGGNAFTDATFSCNTSAPCSISFFVKGELISLLAPPRTHAHTHTHCRPAFRGTQPCRAWCWGVGLCWRTCPCIVCAGGQGAKIWQGFSNEPDTNMAHSWAVTPGPKASTDPAGNPSPDCKALCRRPLPRSSPFLVPFP